MRSQSARKDDNLVNNSAVTRDGNKMQAYTNQKMGRPEVEWAPVHGIMSEILLYELYVESQ